MVLSMTIHARSFNSEKIRKAVLSRTFFATHLTARECPHRPILHRTKFHQLCLWQLPLLVGEQSKIFPLWHHLESWDDKSQYLRKGIVGFLLNDPIV